MVKFLILLSFLFICNEARVLRFLKIRPLCIRHKVYINARNPARYFNPSLPENNIFNMYPTQTIQSSTKFDTEEDQTTTLKATTLNTSDATSTNVASDATSDTVYTDDASESTSTLDTSDTTSTNDASETTSTFSTTSATSNITPELSTLDINSVTNTNETTSTTVVSESTTTDYQRTISVTSDIITSDPDETTRYILSSETSTINADAFSSTTALIDTTSSVKTTTDRIITSDSVNPTSSLTEKVSTTPTNTPSFIISTIDESGSGSGSGDDEDNSQTSKTTIFVQSTVDEYGNDNDDDEDRAITTSTGTSIIIVAATTPVTNQDNNNEGSGDDNFSGDDGSGIDVVHHSRTISKKTVKDSNVADDDFTFNDVDETEKAANPKFLDMFSASSLLPKKNSEVQFTPEIINSDNKKRVADPMLINSLNFVFKESNNTSQTSSTDKISNDLETVTGIFEETIKIGITTVTHELAKSYVHATEAAIDDGYEHFPEKSTTENKTRLLTETIIDFNSSNHEKTRPKSSNTTNNNSTSNNLGDKQPYDVIADHILKLERGNLDEDYYIIVDGYDYTAKPLSEYKTSKDQIENTDKVYDSIESVTTEKDFENRKNNMIVG